MARRKRSSITLEKAERRASGMNSIGANLSFGDDLTLASFWEDINSLRNLQQEYNQDLSSLDNKYNQILLAEKALSTKSERLLTAVAVLYGPDSSKYEMARGKRRAPSDAVTRAPQPPKSPPHNPTERTQTKFYPRSQGNVRSLFIDPIALTLALRRSHKAHLKPKR
jgi:hypothetical protein